jgi:hypothetical protein
MVDSNLQRVVYRKPQRLEHEAHHLSWARLDDLNITPAGNDVRMSSASSHPISQLSSVQVVGADNCGRPSASGDGITWGRIESSTEHS